MNKVNDYQALKEIYYSDTSGKNETYEKEYINRLYSTFSIVYDLSINSYPVFLCITPEIFNILNSLLTKKEQLNNIIRDTKEEIITNYSYITLFNEIENTNKIEGVTSTKKALENTLDIINSNKIVAIKNSDENRLYGLVKKYLMLTRTNDKDINNDDTILLNSSKDIRNLYDELLYEEIKHNDKNNLPDGDIFRKSNVYIYNDYGNVIHEGIKKEDNIITYMDKSLDILNDKNYELINICVFHYLFGYIHPFYDGNGRTNRFITSYKLNKYFNNNLIGLKLSQVIYKTRNSYNKMFKETNDILNRSDLTLFVTYMLYQIDKDIDELIRDISSCNDKYNKYRNKLDKISLSIKDSNKESILDVLLITSLFGYKGIKIDELVSKTNISSFTIKNAISELNDIKLLKIKKDGKALTYMLDLNKI